MHGKVIIMVMDYVIVKFIKIKMMGHTGYRGIERTCTYKSALITTFIPLNIKGHSVISWGIILWALCQRIQNGKQVK